MKTQTFCLTLFFLSFISLGHSQVAINTTNARPDSSAMMDIQSTNRGFLLPRMTSVQRRNIVNPAFGLIVFDTDRQSLFVFVGVWKSISLSDLPTQTTAAGVEAADGAAGDALGHNVKISGSYAIAGAYYDDVNGNTDQGSAYVYKLENGTWQQMQKLVANDGAANDNFGGGVAIDSNYIIVGAAGDDVGENLNQGSAYLFKLENGIWVQKQKITSVSATSGDGFGAYIGISKGTAVIGAAFDDIGAATDAGSAYIFKFTEPTGLFVEAQKIYPSDGAAGDNFGNTVSINGNRMIITAILDDTDGFTDRGSAYVYINQNNTWVFSGKLVANDGLTGDNLGTLASIQGDYAIVGAYAADLTNPNQGAVYLFKYESGVWLQKQKVLPLDPVTNGFFGNSVCLRDNYAIIGSHGTNNLQGSVYVFQLNTITNSLSQVQKITASDASNNDYLGFSSDLNQSNVIIGAFGKSGQKGKVYSKAID